MVLYYQEYGNKDAALMLFLHGGGVSGWIWDRQIEFFTNYHCIVPDLPEHGKSTDQHKFTIRESAAELTKLIEATAQGKKVIAIGFSLGSQVLIQMLSEKPDLIDIAIINSALVKPSPLAHIFIRPAIKLSFPLVKKRWFSKLQAKTLYLNGNSFEKYYQESLQIKRDSLIRVLEENMLFKIPEGFSKANGKILVTVGEKEKEIMKKSAKELVEANSNCMGVAIPKIAHGLPVAMPDFFNQMVEAWINRGELPKGCKVIS